ncbi:sugar phosphate isomerase/epimerase [Fontisphaera persica]|uniref:sugar phosphate isomerase/epimerase family protein n=1 Tax=Fontisphaera persica TaxID=2974023 RepID=UPI0024C0207C|nr:sugar phosphate isomerase/epimerase family protein [Fontisphaera persica]WCJ59115.1 sugar phosphate isomerase/epimerase [Fontisphaera persica]
MKTFPATGLNRREFLGLTATAAAALSLPSAAGLGAAEPARPRRPILVFSKAFQQLSPQATADLVAEVGWDGIECPIRKGGQVLPERVEEDLPKLVEALGQRGKQIYIATTDVGEVNPLNEKVLRALSRAGIRHFRMTHFRYDLRQPIAEQLARLKPRFQEVAALSRELGLRAGYQNHSGSGYVGGPLWDLHLLMEGTDPQVMGVHFDIGHATVEGGSSWPLEVKLLESRFHAVYVKDFYWEKANNQWRQRWCPLGEGMIPRAFFQQLKTSAFAGPISMHFEYPMGNEQETLRQYKDSLARLKEWLA